HRIGGAALDRQRIPPQFPKHARRRFQIVATLPLAALPDIAQEFLLIPQLPRLDPPAEAGAALCVACRQLAPPRLDRCHAQGCGVVAGQNDVVGKGEVELKLLGDDVILAGNPVKLLRSGRFSPNRVWLRQKCGNRHFVSPSRTGADLPAAWVISYSRYLYNSA